jgi:hypothetical protein
LLCVPHLGISLTGKIFHSEGLNPKHCDLATRRNHGRKSATPLATPQNDDCLSCYYVKIRLNSNLATFGIFIRITTSRMREDFFFSCRLYTFKIEKSVIKMVSLLLHVKYSRVNNKKLGIRLIFPLFLLHRFITQQTYCCTTYSFLVA